MRKPSIIITGITLFLSIECFNISGEPNGKMENCVEFLMKGKWNDLPCDKKRGYICKKHASTTPQGTVAPTTTIIPPGRI